MTECILSLVRGSQRTRGDIEEEHDFIQLFMDAEADPNELSAEDRKQMGLGVGKGKLDTRNIEVDKQLTTWVCHMCTCTTESM